MGAAAIQIAVVSDSRAFVERVEGWPHIGFEFKKISAVTSKRIDVLCFGPDTKPSAFKKWRSKFPKSRWIWLKETWRAADLVGLDGELPGLTLSLKPEDRLMRQWSNALQSIREAKAQALSEKDLKRTGSSIAGLMAFIKKIAGARDISELMNDIHGELATLGVDGGPVLLLVKSHSASELYYFRNPSSSRLTSRPVSTIDPPRQRVRIDDSSDRQFLANQLGRPVGKVVAFPLAHAPDRSEGPATTRWMIRPVIFFEYGCENEALPRLIDHVGQRFQAVSLVLDRLVLEQELTRSSRMWERTFDSIEEPIAIVGLDGELVRANRQFTARGLSGMENGLIKNKDALFQVDRFEIRIKNQGPVLSTVVHYHDVTKPMNLRERMIQTEKMSAIGHLAGHVAHELNNPLTGIRSLAQILQEDLPRDSRLKADLGEVERASARCQEIILNFLEFSKGNMDAQRKICDLNEIVTKTLPFLKSALGRHTNQIELNPRPLMIDVEPQLMQQVVFNIVNNACQALAGVTGTLEIRTEVSDSGGRRFAVLSVKDSGPGVPKDLQDSIFEPFFTTKQEGQGTGLGLSFSREFVRRFGGDVTCESELGQGALFRVVLPLDEAARMGEAS